MSRVRSKPISIAAVIVVLVLLGQVMELKARADRRSHPPTARTRSEDGPYSTSRWCRRRGAVGTNPSRRPRMRIRPGERVPTDGVVLEGKANWMNR